jgi:hypothetical protein
VGFLASSTVLLAMQADFNLNPTTLGLILAIGTGLVGAITFLFKWATRTATEAQMRETTRLEAELGRERAEKQEILETLIDVLRTAHRSTDAADDATRELLRQRRVKRPAK